MKFKSLSGLFVVFAVAFYSSTLLATPAFPTVSAISPTSGSAGTFIVVTGSGFTGANAAWVGAGRDAVFVVNSDTQVTITVPTDASTGPIAVIKSPLIVYSAQTFSFSGGGGGGSGVPGGNIGQVQYNFNGLLFGGITAGGTCPSSQWVTQITSTITPTCSAIPVFTTTVAGLTPISPGGTTQFLRADQTWAVPPGSSATSYTVDGNTILAPSNVLQVGTIPSTKVSGLANSATTDTTNAANIVSGTLSAARLPAFVGDATSSSGTSTLTLATSGVTAGAYGAAAIYPICTFNAKGLATTCSNHGIVNTDLASAIATVSVPGAMTVDNVSLLINSSGQASVNIGTNVNISNAATYAPAAIVGQITLTAAQTTPLVVSLAAASNYGRVKTFCVVDKLGTITSTNTLTLTPNGTDTINGVNGNFVLKSAFDGPCLTSDGSGSWTIDVLGPERLAPISTLTVGSGSTGGLFEAYTGGGSFALYSTSVTPGASNYSFASNGGSTYINGSTTSCLKVGGTSELCATASGVVLTNLLESLTAPTLTGTGLGTTPAITANGTAAMDITVGTSPAAATFTLTLPAATNGWVCTGNDITTQSATVAQLKQVGGTTTTAVLENFNSSMAAAALVAADHLRVACSAY